MSRRVFPLSRAKTVINTGVAPSSPQFETKCLVDCGNVVLINNDNNPNRSLAVWKMQADTSGTATINLSITLGTAKVRVYDHPEGTLQNNNGANVLYKSINQLQGLISFTVDSDKPYLFIDFTEKSENVQIQAQILCYTNTSVVTNPDAYYPEIVDIDNVVIEQGETVEVAALVNSIRRDLLSYSTLKVVLVPSGSAVEKPTGGIIAITAPVWSGTPASYAVHFTVKDNLGITHCGNINVLTQNTSVTYENQPEAVDDTANVNENQSVTINVLANDTSDTFEPSSVRIVSQPAIGSVLVNSDGSITYNAPEVGADTIVTFDYGVKKFTGDTEYTATVTVNVFNVIPTVQLFDDVVRLKVGQRIEVRPTANDNVNESDIITFGITGGQPIPNVQDVFTSSSTLQVFLTGKAVGSQTLEYFVTTGAGTFYADLLIEVYDDSVVTPSTLQPNIVLLDILKSPIANGGNLAFGNVKEDKIAAQIVTVRNTGTAPLVISSVGITGDFTTNFLPVTISVGGSTNFQIVMNPTSTGDQTGVLTIGSNDLDTPSYVVNLNGGVEQNLAPKLTILEGNSIIPNNGSSNYGNVSFGQTKTKEFVLRNDGNSALTVSNSLSNGDYSSSFNGVIPAGQQVTVPVTLTPTASGQRTGVFTVISDDSNTPYRINLSANVIQVVTITEPNIQLLESDQLKNPFQTIDFGSHQTTETVSKTIEIYNNGNAVLNLSSITTPTGFTASGFTSGSIAAGASEEVTFTLDTSVEASYEGLAIFNSNDPDTAQYNLNLKGVVNLLEPLLVVVNTANDQIIKHTDTQLFTTVEQNEDSVVVFELQNLGDNTLNVSDIQVTGDFTLESIFQSGQIDVNASRLVNVKKDTSTTGDKTGTLTVTSNDPTNGTYTINLSGKVLAIPAPNILVREVAADKDISSGGSVDYGTHEVGFRESKFLAIVNQGTADLIVSSLSISADFTTPALSVTIPAGQSEIILVTLDDTALGSKAGTLTINSNDPDTSAYTVDLVAEVVAPPQALIQVTRLSDNKQLESIPNGERTIFDRIEYNIPRNNLSKSVREEKEISFQVKNIGNADLVITSATVSDTRSINLSFATNGLNVTLASGESTIFIVKAIAVNENTENHNLDDLTLGHGEGNRRSILRINSNASNGTIWLNELVASYFASIID